MAVGKTRPYVRDLLYRGHVEGITHLDADGSPICHYFGGIPYALPPIGPYRFRKPRPLPPCYKYGTTANPGRFNGGAALSPQPGFTGPPNEKLFDEDCLQLNIWIPTGSPPDKGWPVLFFMHGGWLQFGTPNSLDCRALLSDAAASFIIVAPAYRLNLFGFLAGKELESDGCPANAGFWDQRLALEWTWKNISYFSGDAANITISGYSAGAHSTFQQLAYDLFQAPPSARIVRRAIMFSNGPGPQPKPLHKAQRQFDELLVHCSIPLSLSSAEKLQRLRKLPAKTLLTAASRMTLHEFRAATDGFFIGHDLFRHIDSGEFGACLKARGIQLMLGECEAERHLYGIWRTPRDNTLAAVRRRLYADYDADIVDTLLAQHYCPGGRLPTDPAWIRCDDWPQVFGAVYGDMQVHALQRGFVAALERGGAADLVRRYRIEWRAECADSFAPRDMGVTHSTDMPIWFFGNGAKRKKGGVGLTDKEKVVVRRWLEPVVGWIRGDGAGEWGTSGVRQSRRLRSDGGIDVWNDGDWERGVGVWQSMRSVQRRADEEKHAKL